MTRDSFVDDSELHVPDLHSIRELNLYLKRFYGYGTILQMQHDRVRPHHKESVEIKSTSIVQSSNFFPKQYDAA